MVDYDMENYADQGLKVFTNTFQYNSPYHVKVEFKNYFINSKRFSSSIIPYGSQARSRVPPRFHLCISSLKNKFTLYSVRLKNLCMLWRLLYQIEENRAGKNSRLSHMWINWSNAEMNLKSIPTDSTFK